MSITNPPSPLPPGLGSNSPDSPWAGPSASRGPRSPKHPDRPLRSARQGGRPPGPCSPLPRCLWDGGDKVLGRPAGVGAKHTPRTTHRAWGGCCACRAYTSVLPVQVAGCHGNPFRLTLPGLGHWPWAERAAVLEGTGGRGGGGEWPPASPCQSGGATLSRSGHVEAGPWHPPAGSALPFSSRASVGPLAPLGQSP